MTEINEPSVYIIGYEDKRDKYKVGYSQNVKSRLSALQTGSPDKLILRKAVEFESETLARKIEDNTKKALVEFKLNGEWFANTFQFVENTLEQIRVLTFETCRELEVYREFSRNQRLAKNPSIRQIPVGSFAMALQKFGTSTVDIKMLDHSPVLQVEDKFKASDRYMFQCVEHYGPLPTGPEFRLRHAADVLCVDRNTAEFVMQAVKEKIANDAT